MTKKVLTDQYEKALQMIEDTISRYDDALWIDEKRFDSPAWQIAYHAISYTNIYCCATEAGISHWPKSRGELYILGPNARDHGERGYTKAEMLDFVAFVRRRIPSYLDEMKPDEPCWPYWYDQTQIEFHLNNLRHLQHHTGQLIERHDANGGFDYEWR